MHILLKLLLNEIVPTKGSNFVLWMYIDQNIQLEEHFNNLD